MINTALELMKSRYEAYKKNDMEYIKETQTEELNNDIDWDILKEWNESCKWINLEILNVEKGDITDLEGIVEFKAIYIENNREVEHHEKSLFVKNDGKWYYKKWLLLEEKKLDLHKIGRNEFCPCGSGKKFKKCCGNKH